MYQPLYGPQGSVIFDHPYNAEYGVWRLLGAGIVSGAHIRRFWAPPSTGAGRRLRGTFVALVANKLWNSRLFGHGSLLRRAASVRKRAGMV